MNSSSSRHHTSSSSRKRSDHEEEPPSSSRRYSHDTTTYDKDDSSHRDRPRSSERHHHSSRHRYRHDEHHRHHHHREEVDEEEERESKRRRDETSTRQDRRHHDHHRSDEGSRIKPFDRYEQPFRRGPLPPVPPYSQHHSYSAVGAMSLAERCQIRRQVLESAGYPAPSNKSNPPTDNSIVAVDFWTGSEEYDGFQSMSEDGAGEDETTALEEGEYEEGEDDPRPEAGKQPSSSIPMLQHSIPLDKLVSTSGPSQPVPPPPMVDTSNQEDTSDDDDGDEFGPTPLYQGGKQDGKLTAEHHANMLKGEGAAYAAFIKSGKRIPRRGEIGLEPEQISTFEKMGYVMSGSRNAVINAMRLRKENQVITAEEKLRLLEFNREANIKKEAAVITTFREFVRQKQQKP